MAAPEASHEDGPLGSPRPGAMTGTGRGVHPAPTATRVVPLRIEARLLTPAVWRATPPCLDALLAYGAVQHSLTTGTVRDPADPWAAERALPLAVAGDAQRPDAWVWQASAVFGDPVGPSEFRFGTTRVEPADFARAETRGILVPPRKRQFRTGMWKGALIRRPMTPIDRIVAYAVGDPEQIAMLLRYVTSVGADRRLGAGRVHSEGWRVVEDRAAARGWMLRPLPVAMHAQAERAFPSIPYATAFEALQSPYWHRGHLSPVVRPVWYPTSADVQMEMVHD